MKDPQLIHELSPKGCSESLFRNKIYVPIILVIMSLNDIHVTGSLKGRHT